MVSCCEQFGFDEKKIKQRLAFLYLTSADIPWAEKLQNEVIIPNLDTIVERFYEVLLFHAESRRFLYSGDVIEKLKRTQKQYLLTLGKRFNEPQYFEDRLKIGVVHAAIHLPLSVYQCAYSNLSRFILEAFPACIAEDPAEYSAMVKFLYKITALDMSLAVETYHTSQVIDYEQMLKNLSDRESYLQVKATTDFLTGCLNREKIYTELNKAIGVSPQLHILMIDLDHFKAINDTYGHQAGDKVLSEVANRIKQVIRGNDVLGRYGGEEFLVGLLDADRVAAEKVGNRIRECIEKKVISTGSETLRVSASIGMASLEEDDDLNSLIRRADQALYAAKNAGRNCFVAK